MSASGKPENVSIRSRDYWFESEWYTWALIEPAVDGSVTVHFINDESEHFGELAFVSNEKALEALRKNKFICIQEDNIAQRIHRPPSPPFRRILRPNLLCSIFWTDVLVSEADTLQKIAAMLERYEPRVELQGAFLPGVRGRADPRFSETRAERLRLLTDNKPGAVLQLEALADTFDLTHQDGAEADPRINWRVTARHGDYFIHIMALDQGLSRFACCVQKTSDFKESLNSYGVYHKVRYETGTLAEIELVLDDIYAGFKHEDEERRQQERIDEEIQKAVERERAIWRDRLARSSAKRRQVVGLSLSVTALLLLFGINGYLGGKPGRIIAHGIDAALNVVSAALAGGLGALLSALLYFYLLASALDKFGFLDKSGKATPRATKITLTSSWIVFAVLWAVLTYVIFRS